MSSKSKPGLGGRGGRGPNPPSRGANAKIGKNTVIYSNAFIGMGSSLGDNCIIYPNAVMVHVQNTRIAIAA